MMEIKIHDVRRTFEHDWNGFIEKILNVRLTKKQREVVLAVQENPRVAVRSCHSFGKDYVAAAISLAFLYIFYHDSKVVNTAPTDRQVVDIMMAEVARMHMNAKIVLGGVLTTHKITFSAHTECYFEGFKARDKASEAWTGYHAPNLLVVVTEASGIEPITFTAIEGLLTGNSRLLVIGNPNRLTGEFHAAFSSPRYKQFKFSAFDSPNVRAKKILVPGQIDYPWVLDKVQNWCERINENEAIPEEYDFQFEGQWYRPDDTFLIKVLGEFPREGEDQLVPRAWLDAAYERWEDLKNERVVAELRLGVDVAGMGRDMTVFCYRYDNYVPKMERFSGIDDMPIAGRVKNALRHEVDFALIDTIGEGAGVHSRLNEQGVNSVSAKFSEAAKDKRGNDLTDYTKELKFLNMRSYCYWAIRDALNPKNGINLALPPIDELTQDLTETTWDVRSDGKIRIEEKDKIKERLKRSPDYGDALALSFFPVQVSKNKWARTIHVKERKKPPQDIWSKWDLR